MFLRKFELPNDGFCNTYSSQLEHQPATTIPSCNEPEAEETSLFISSYYALYVRKYGKTLQLDVKR
jgi:hypothetical protein